MSTAKGMSQAGQGHSMSRERYARYHDISKISETYIHTVDVMTLDR